MLKPPENTAGKDALDFPKGRPNSDDLVCYLPVHQLSASLREILNGRDPDTAFSELITSANHKRTAGMRDLALKDTEAAFQIADCFFSEYDRRRAQVQFELAEICCEQGNFEAAQFFYQNAAELFIEHRDGFGYIISSLLKGGRCLYDCGTFDRAETAFLQAEALIVSFLNLNPSLEEKIAPILFESLSYLAMITARTNRPNRALEYVDRGLKLIEGREETFPRVEVTLLEFRARIRAEVGDHSGAVQDIRSVILGGGIDIILSHLVDDSRSDNSNN